LNKKTSAGSFTLHGNSMTLNRIGYGAMLLAGPRVWRPPPDVSTAIAGLREAVESGVNHIDTSDYYGPHVTNQLIKEAPSLCQGSRDRHESRRSWVVARPFQRRLRERSPAENPPLQNGIVRN
jgi:aryl-alcohol dehydrogenase-like predicted oxidoreductase